MRYECCYASGKQFIFAEKVRFSCAITFMMITGLITGSLISCVIGLAGIEPFEISFTSICLVSGCFACAHACDTKSPTADVAGFITGCSEMIGLLIALLTAIRCSLWLDLDTMSRCTLFGVVGAILGLLLYGFASLCCQEDERKHHLRLCETQADTQFSNSEHDTDCPDGAWASLLRFGRWIISFAWWHDLRFEPLSESSQDVVTVHNRSLKLIKVCFYSSDDLLCWVPFGGVSGRCVGLVGAEKQRSFTVPRVKGTSPATFILKVFQPSTFDKELACYSRAQCGQSFEFHYVEGLVKRSRQLCAVTLPRIPRGNFHVESSEDEVQPMKSIRMSGFERDARCQVMSNPGLRRNLSSQSSLSTVASAGEVAWDISEAVGHADFGVQSPKIEMRPSSEQLVPSGRNIVSSQRRAHPDEVVIRNRSNQEIRACLFRSNDYCYVVPLVGHIIACGDCILPDSERRFNPSASPDSDFTLKVYSVGPSAKELTYLTVSRGNAYTFCDSLLS